MTSILLRRRKLGAGSCRGIEARSTEGILTFRNDEVYEEDTSIDYLFRWGCTSTFDTTPSSDPTVVNKASSIHWCSDKRQGRLDMASEGVTIPQTWGSRYEFGESVHSGSAARWVARPVTHAQGRQFVHSSDPQVIIDALGDWGGGYVSEFIDKVAEYRVAIVCNRVAWVTRKTPGNPNDVAWNVARGGRFDNVRWRDWPMQVIAQALRAARVSGTDFCGVDVMVDAEGTAFVLEVNSAPSLTSPYRQQCFARAFDYIVQNGKDHFPAPARIRGWKDVIHPAVRNADG